MKLLGLFRHAKSDWQDPRARDFDRQLNARGREGAAVMGRHIRDHGPRWDRIISSPAIRCAETIEIACQAAGRPVAVQWDRRIYLASSATLLDLLRTQDDSAKAVLMVGHNPGLEDLIFDLVPDDGTSPLRDGVDVPGHSLRLVVMEQVPWPKPSILHRARRLAGGGAAHDDRIIRARLAQAFGRLIRSSQDHGMFVVLSAAFPSRLLSACPPGTPIARVTLDEALQRVASGVSRLPVQAEQHP